MCATCADKGIVTLNWADAEPEYAVCLCEAGKAMRKATNEGRKVVPLWRVWCTREQVDPERLFRIEDVLTAEELAERGLTVTVARVDREAALLKAGKSR